MKPSLVTYPDERLRQPAAPVTVADAELHALIATLREAMIEGDGVGMAAPQLGVSRQVFVVGYAGLPEVFVNPRIVERSREATIQLEGCLSFPGQFLPVPRSDTITVEAQDANLQPFKLTLNDFAARIVQHETDHLLGKLLLDRALYEAVG